jgi:hypothetical protein
MPSRSADSPGAEHSRHFIRTVLQVYPQHILVAIGDLTVIGNHLLIEQNTRQLPLEIGTRHINPIMPRLVSVPDSGEHIGNRIGHRHNSSLTEWSIIQAELFCQKAESL